MFVRVAVLTLILFTSNLYRDAAGLRYELGRRTENIQQKGVGASSAFVVAPHAMCCHLATEYAGLPLPSPCPFYCACIKTVAHFC